MVSKPHWHPSASLEILRERAAIISKIRAFFTQQQYLEVETPILSQFGVTDVYLNNITAQLSGKAYYLQTSPEHHMKRLLAAGSGPIFQLARVFRDDEIGRWHNPEFVMLEWYKLGIDHFALMDEVEQFLQAIIQSPPLLRKTYQQAFIAACNLDPFSTNITCLKQTLKYFNLANVLDQNEQDPNQYLFLLMTHVVEPFFRTQPIAIYNFPSSQAALSIVRNGVAERFEVYYHGIELANGFHELIDAKILAARFNADLTKRQQLGIAIPNPDQYLQAALAHGLPACSGIALGIDRLLTLALGCKSISKAMAFDITRA